MIVQRESWNYNKGADVWIGKYLNSRNLPHWHPDCELIALECGRLNVVCENKIYVLEQGEAFFVDSQQVHYMQACQPDTKLYVVIFDRNVIRNYFADNVLACPLLGDKYDVAKLYDGIRNELVVKQPYYNDVAKSLIAKFFIDVIRNEKLDKRKEKNATGRLKTLLDKIDNEFDVMTFDKAHDFMAMDKAYFCRFFKKATGMSFTQYLNTIKIDNAVRMLRQDANASVTSVAFACGFGSIRHFNMVFKELTGYSPKTLPDDFNLTKQTFHTDSAFNPTLADCILLEEF